VTASDRRSLTPTWLLVLCIVANAVAAALTLIFPDVLVGPAAMNGSAYGTALIMLVLGLPLTVVSIFVERSGSRFAPMLRIGLLAYLAYNGFLFLFATPFNRWFVFYVVAMSSTVFALGASALRAGSQAAELRLGRTPARVIGGYVMVIVALNTLLWLRGAVPPLFSDDPSTYLEGMGVATNPVVVQDLVFWLPAAFIAGWLTWTRRPWGALLAGSYLVYGVIESIGVATDQWMGSTADPSSTVASMGAVVIFVVLAVIGLAALAYFARAIARSEPKATAVPAQERLEPTVIG
jgi:hypothetical protein